jgi:hypothetical protein
MPSAVRSRIASFEAASSKGGAPSPSRPISTKSNYNRPKNTSTVPQKKPDVAKQQQEQQQQDQQEEQIQTQQHKAHKYRRRSRSKSRETKGTYRDKKNASSADTSLNTSIGNDKSDEQGYKSNSNITGEQSSGGEGSYVGSASSTTVTASENRKTRIRQSQQLIREYSSPAPLTNLSEKRQQRRVLQSQRRTKTPSKGAEGDTTARASGSRSGSRNDSPARTPIDNSRVPDSPGDMSTGSNSRLSKASRLQRRPNTLNQRQSSAATTVTRASGNSVETSLIRNTATNAAAKLGSRRGTKPVTPSTRLGSFDRMMSATIGLSPKIRKHKQQSPKNSSPSQRSVQSTKSSRSNSNNYADQHQLNASLEAPTDDDATLTNVHRIMEGKNSKNRRIPSDLNQNQNHSYETLLGQQQQNPSMSGRHSGKYDNHNSYDSSVGPSWKLNRGAGNRNSIWKEDEKSDKMGYGTSGGRVLRTEYSSDYDMDDVRSRQSTHFAEGPINSQATDANDYFANSRYHNMNNMNSSILQNNINSNNNRRIDDDDRTFDYGDRDDDSNEGASYARRRREAEQRRGRLTASSNTNDLNNNNNIPNSNFEQGIHQAGGGTNANNGEPMLLSKDDMVHLTMKDSPALRLSAGVAAVATVGLCIGGPVGLLAGVAAGGLSFGFMQIPEEERKKIQAQAEKAVSSLQEKACDASESMSSSCINTYQDSGVADHVPHCLSSNIADQLVPSCPTGVSTAKSESIYNAAGTTINSAHLNGTHAGGANNPEHSSAIAAGPIMEPKASSSMPHNERMRNKKVACLRNVRILPIAQIHGLEPSSQPRAWLDVVASANTSNEQKNEAMEEILLLAKDKRRAKIFLDEGILDYIIWTLSRYIEKVEVVGKATEWVFPDITQKEKTAANLAAMCCVTLGKAHCAAIHTEGDLLLMSMYERGTVPEERQVAQMLHEVPHHARVTKTNDPTIVQPSKEVFAPRQLNLAQAEELAKSFKLVAEGRM